MKKISVFILFITVSVLLIGCTKTSHVKQAKLNELFDLKKIEEKNSIEKLAWGDYSFKQNKEQYFLFVNSIGTNFVLYNSETQESKELQLQTNEYISLYNTYYVIRERNSSYFDYKSTTYSYNHELLKKYVATNISYYSNSIQVWELSNQYTDYYYDDKVHSVPREEKEYDLENDQYQYLINDDSVMVYKDHIPIFIFKKPSYAASYAAFVLANGNVIYQYSIVESVYSEKYDYLEGENKYSVKTFIYDVKKGSTKEIKLDYLIYSTDNRLIQKNTMLPEYVTYKNDKVNFMLVTKIQDKRINDYYYDWLITDNNLKVKSSLNSNIKYLKGLMLLDKDTIIAGSEQAIYILNASGKILYTYAIDQIIQVNSKYIVIKNYSGAGHVIINIKTGKKETGYTVYGATNGTLFLLKTVEGKKEYYLYKNDVVVNSRGASTAINSTSYSVEFLDSNTNQTMYDIYTDKELVLSNVTNITTQSIYTDVKTQKNYTQVKFFQNNMLQLYLFTTQGSFMINV